MTNIVSLNGNGSHTADSLGRLVDIPDLSGGKEQPNSAASIELVGGLDEVVAAFRRWLYLPDPGVVKVVLATVAANYAPGDPVWLVLVGPPGSGKTEVLNAFAGLRDVHSASVLNESSLLSGTPRIERTKDATGGLLKKIGKLGILLIKDFGGVLSMHRDARGAVLAALREIYDGAWTRHLGVEGGQTLNWAGKMGLIGGATPSIDAHHGVMSSLGERFVFYRLPKVDETELARQALGNQGRELRMRAELDAAVKKFIGSLRIPDRPVRLSRAEQERLIALAALAARSRSPVERDGHTREITLIPGSEAPTRLAGVLGRLYSGLRMIGEGDAEAWRLTKKVAFDSMPKVRGDVLAVLTARGIPLTTVDIAGATGLSVQTTRRALEDLASYDVISRSGLEKAEKWSVSAWSKRMLRAAGGVPEASGGESVHGSTPGAEQTFPETSGGEQSFP